MDEFKQDDEEIPVLFRRERRKDGEVTAVFPTLPHDIDGRLMMCYAHVGQHGGCAHRFAWDGRPATPEEYAPLKAELEGRPYGYRLKVYKRTQPWMRKAFDAEVTRLRSHVGRATAD